MQFAERQKQRPESRSRWRLQVESQKRKVTSTMYYVNKECYTVRDVMASYMDLLQVSSSS